MRKPSDTTAPSSLAQPFDLAPVAEVLRFEPPTVHLNDKAKGILTAVLAEIEALGRWEESDGQTVWRPRELTALRHVGVPYRPAAWFGGPLGCAQRQAYSRAVRRLDRAGLVWLIRQRRRDRVSYLQLTAAGLRWALAGSRVDHTALAEGLRRTVWGADLAGEVSHDAPSATSLPVEETHEHGSSL